MSERDEYDYVAEMDVRRSPEFPDVVWCAASVEVEGRRVECVNLPGHEGKHLGFYGWALSENGGTE